MASSATQCTNQDCSFDEDAQCVENNDVDSCPFRSGRPLILADPDEVAAIDDGDEADHADHDEPSDDDEDAIELESGLRLSSAQCLTTVASTPSRIISLIAPRKAGKTSLIAGMYEMFLENRAGDILFYGSRTIMGFERLCHLSRAVSGATSPDMERTRHAEGLGYFHIDVLADDKRLAVLLADRPGETFVIASRSIAEMEKLTEVGSASTILYLVDGEMLASDSQKATPKALAVQIFDALESTGLLNAKPALALVLTKSDLLAAPGDPAVFGRFDRVTEFLADKYSHYFSEVTSFQTSASPTVSHPDFSRGSGLPLLMRHLLRDERITLRTEVKTNVPKRFYGRFGQTGTAS